MRMASPSIILLLDIILQATQSLKKINKVKRASKKPVNIALPLKLNRPSGATWTIENIKIGIDKYLLENGSMPTARDFDESNYLPSARQIQRAFGGLIQLRVKLGYDQTDFTKGELRKSIAISANKRGVSAEDYFEPLLVEKFGEPFVHVQKRYYKGSRCRYDFFVYAKQLSFGVDIFTTDRKNYIDKNIRHKIIRYKNAPSSLIIYFVLVGNDFTPYDVEKARESIRELDKYPNMVPLHETEFMELLSTFEPLKIPEFFYGLDEQE